MKPQLHSSHLDTFFMCAYRFYLRHRMNIIVPPGFVSKKNLSAGTGTHGGVAADLMNYIALGLLLSLEEVQDAARDATNESWENEPPEPIGDEKDLKMEDVRGEAVDTAVSLVTLHHEELAPTIEPIHVERPWVLELPNWPYDLSGRIDTQAKPQRLIDLKTASKKPSANDAHNRDQMTIYSLAALKIDGVAPDLEVHYLVKGKTPSFIVQQTSRDKDDYESFYRRYEIFCEADEKEVWMPTSQQNWWCDPLYCGYALKHCKYYRRGK